MSAYPVGAEEAPGEEAPFLKSAQGDGGRAQQLRRVGLVAVVLVISLVAVGCQSPFTSSSQPTQVGPAPATLSPSPSPPAAAVSFGPPNWFEKSMHVCTNSDGADVKKCPSTSTLECPGKDLGSMYCDQSEQKSCQEVADGISPAQPDGFGFMCPSLMIGTSEMIAAATGDGYAGVYAVATIDQLDCGQCVEIINDDPENFPASPTILAQIFNSVADNIDLYMAGGGLGAFNGCHHVGDVTPILSMYEKYPTADNDDFIEYLNSIGYPEAKDQLDHAMQWSGGIRGSKTYADCRAQNKTVQQCMPAGNGCDGGGGICIRGHEACEKAFVGKSDYITQKAIESCKFAFDKDLHWNRPVTYTVVACPETLTHLTGLKPSNPSDIGNPSPVKSSTTTMEDCCEPTCSHQANVNPNGKKDDFWQPHFDALYACNLNGERYVDSAAFPNPCSEAPTPPPTPPPPIAQASPAASVGGLPSIAQPAAQTSELPSIGQPAAPTSGACVPNPQSDQHAAAAQCAGCAEQKNKYWPCGITGSDGATVCIGDGGTCTSS